MEMLMKGQRRRIRLRNVIVFTETIFGKKESVFGSVGGWGRREAADERLTMVCAATPPVFIGRLKASKCAVVCGPQVLPKSSGRAASTGPQLKQTAQTQWRESYEGFCRSLCVADSFLGWQNNSSYSTSLFLSA